MNINAFLFQLREVGGISIYARNAFKNQIMLISSKLGNHVTLDRAMIVPMHVCGAQLLLIHCRTVGIENFLRYSNRPGRRGGGVNHEAQSIAPMSLESARNLYPVFDDRTEYFCRRNGNKYFTCVPSGTKTTKNHALRVKVNLHYYVVTRSRSNQKNTGCSNDYSDWAMFSSRSVCLFY